MAATRGKMVLGCDRENGAKLGRVSTGSAEGVTDGVGLGRVVEDVRAGADALTLVGPLRVRVWCGGPPAAGSSHTTAALVGRVSTQPILRAQWVDYHKARGATGHAVESGELAGGRENANHTKVQDAEHLADACHR